MITNPIYSRLNAKITISPLKINRESISTQATTNSSISDGKS